MLLADPVIGGRVTTYYTYYLLLLTTTTTYKIPSSISYLAKLIYKQRGDNKKKVDQDSLTSVIHNLLFYVSLEERVR